MKRLLKWCRLPAAQRHQLVQVGLWVALIRLGLSVLPFALLRNLLGRPRLRRLVPRLHAPATEIAAAVCLASRVVPRATCLVQALALQSLLTRSGHPAHLRIGVAKEQDGQFRAHAWVEHEGHILIGGASSTRYTSLLSLQHD